VTAIFLRLIAFPLFVVVCAAMAQMGPVPAGSFVMGARTGNANEAPEHTVRLSAFLIDKNEVAKVQYDSCVVAGACTPAHYDDGACVAWNGREFKDVRVPQRMRDARFPVVCVSWQQARQYCAFKGKKLPTEAQWEYAALAGREATYAWGNELPDPSRCAREEMHPKKTGSFSPNPWGLYDMTGNVAEWTGDHYQPDYYAESEPDDPKGPEVGQYRVLRGGGWYSGNAQLRIKNRQWFDPNFGEISIGFRCAK
jgi:formylglycine-generating enzyme required for sulfatase activity